MFTRADNSYEHNDSIIKNILNDEASTITRIVNIIPERSKILDVGAGNGVLAKLFKFKNKSVIIDGVEPNKFASNIAKLEYRNFYNGYIQEFMDEILNEKYDFIIFADVIEHIDNPIDVFKDFFKKLDMTTKIIISVPNIAFGAVRLSLMQGSFHYVDSGILEKTHLRFYTLNTLNKLISNLNLNIDELYYLNRNLNNTEIKLNTLKVNPLAIHFVSKDKLSHVYQFLVVLSKEVKLTKEKTYGKKSRFPLLEYIFKPVVMRNVKLKSFVKRFYRL